MATTSFPTPGSPADIEKEAMAVVEKVQNLSRGTVVGMKRLSNWLRRYFETYLDRETSEIKRIGMKG